MFRWRRVICLAALPVFLLTSCSERISRNVLTTVLRVDGDVQAAANENASFGHITAGARFRSGTILRTGQGTMDLLVMPGLQLRLGPNSQLKLEQMLIARDGNETASGMSDRRASLRLLRGIAMVDLQQGDGSWGTLAVSTPHTTISTPRACLFQLEADTDRTRLVCVQGTLFASSQNQTATSIHEGHFAEWPLTQSPAPAETDPGAQTAIADCLKTAAELDQLLEKQPPFIPWQ